MWIEPRRVRTPAGELAVVDAGDPEAPPVVLLHGLATSSYLWRRLIPLASPWTRVIAPDLLGAGASDAPRDVGLGLADHRDVIAAALSELGVGSFAVVGHGDGGAIAQLLAVDADVRALALIDSAAVGAAPSRAMLDLVHERDADAWIRAMFEEGMSHRDRLDEADLHEYLRPYRGRDVASLEAIAERLANDAALEGVGPRLADRDIPALVLWGEDDRFVSVELAERLGEALPRAAVAVLPDCGHFLLEDAPDTVAPLVFQWLRSQYLQQEHRHDDGPVIVQLGRRPTGEDA